MIRVIALRFARKDQFAASSSSPVTTAIPTAFSRRFVESGAPLHSHLVQDVDHADADPVDADAEAGPGVGELGLEPVHELLVLAERVAQRPHVGEDQPQAVGAHDLVLGPARAALDVVAVRVAVGDGDLLAAVEAAGLLGVRSRSPWASSAEKRSRPALSQARNATLGRAGDGGEVADSRFEEQVLASPLPVLLDVWAPWCVPCRGMEPVIEELAASLSGRVRVAKLNLDRNPQSAARLRIQGVPTLIVFKGGHEVGRMVGARGKSELMRALADVD